MKKTIVELWSLMTKDLDWKNRTVKQRIFTVWFGLSFCLLFVCGNSVLAIPAILNLAAASHYTTKCLTIPEE